MGLIVSNDLLLWGCWFAFWSSALYMWIWTQDEAESHLLSFLPFVFRGGMAWTAVQGGGEDEWAGRLLLWANLQRQGGRLQGGRGLDRWLQELHMLGGASHTRLCLFVRVCVCVYVCVHGGYTGVYVRVIKSKRGHSILIKCVRVCVWLRVNVLNLGLFACCILCDLSLCDRLMPTHTLAGMRVCHKINRYMCLSVCVWMCLYICVCVCTGCLSACVSVRERENMHFSSCL